MEVVGTYHKEFPIPVCSAFVNAILNNQVCYKINVNEFIKEAKYDSQNFNLNLFLDYNEEKQYIVQKRETLVKTSLSMSHNLISSKNKANIKEAMIHFGTLGKYFNLIYFIRVHHSFLELSLRENSRENLTESLRESFRWGPDKAPERAQESASESASEIDRIWQLLLEHIPGRPNYD